MIVFLLSFGVLTWLKVEYDEAGEWDGWWDLLTLVFVVSLLVLDWVFEAKVWTLVAVKEDARDA